MRKAASLILIFLTMFSLTSGAVSPNYQKPDFAFPKQVSAKSLVSLDMALSEGNMPLVVRTAIDYELAQSAVDGDSIQSVIDKLIDIEANPKVDRVAKSLLNLFIADIYSGLYSAKRWIYDERQLPLQPLPSDYTLWSGDQFRQEIERYADKAVALADPAKSIGISEYTDVIDIQGDAEPFFPTVYDFIAYKSIDLLKGLSREDILLSWGLLTPCDVYVKQQFTYQSPIVRSILQLYQSLLKLHESEPAPLIMADIERIKFVAQYVDNQSERFTSGLVDDQLPRAYTLLNGLYRKYQGKPYATEALIEAGYYLNAESQSDSVADFVSEARRQLAAAPDYFRNGCLKNIVSQLTMPIVNVSAPSIIVPGDTLKIKVKNLNTANYSVKVYQVPYTIGDNTSYRFDPTNPPTLIRTFAGKEEAKAPFAKDSELRMVLPRAGRYIVVPEIPGVDNGRQYYPSVYCSSLHLSSMSFGKSKWGEVLNPKTGAPVATAKISAFSDKKIVATYTTDKEGCTEIKVDNVRLYAQKGDDKYAQSCFVGRDYNSDRQTNYFVSPFTDLAIYHPGDTVHWSFIAYQSGDRNDRIAADLKLNVILRDANYQAVDTVQVTSDSWGRGEGSFVLPKSGLTGNYQLQFFRVDSPDNKTRNGMCGSRSVMVSDYKLPTYYVEVADVQRDMPGKGDVTVKGRATTYSGFPVADASVTVDLSATPRRVWWFARRNTSFYSTTVTTDADGAFEIVFPAGLLDDAPVPNAVFNAAITATSPTGENQTTSASFTQGKPYAIEYKATLANSDIDIARPVNFGARMIDFSGNQVKADIRYLIIDSDKRTVASGIINDADPSADLTGVKSGTYELRFEPVDTALADATSDYRVVLYRPTDKNCPVSNVALWTPQITYTLNGTRHASILFGVPAKENYVRYAVTSDSTILKQGIMKCAAGLHRLDYNLPTGIDEVRVMLMCMNDYQSTENIVTVRTAESIASINLTIESFRDRLIPGSSETWTFRLTDRAGAPVKAPVMLDMYAKALDRLAAQSFTFRPMRSPSGNFFYNPGESLWWRSSRVSKDFKGERCVIVTDPQFQLWDMPIVNTGHFITYSRAGGVMMKNMSYATADMAMVKEEATVEISEHKEKVYDAGNGVAPESSLRIRGSADARSSGFGASEEPFEYRASEVPLAFFEPMLTTSADGTLNFTFTVPNANTTWNLRALAYTADLLQTELSREIISSKPIMVQPNLPRFLREGDRADIRASVMNNTDTAQTVVTLIEIFDPISGKILGSSTSTEIVAAMSSAKVTMSVEAPADANMIGYRVKSSTAAFADGEQSVIPVLPSSEPVVETTPFYISADEAMFSLKLPKMPKDAKVTLQFCENPTWYVATALPGIREGKSDDALSASAAIFSAAIAEGIMRTDPAIAEAINKWNSSDKSDSTLVSMLERNADLKTVLLSSTPWVMDALSQTERMERLALIFDKGTIDDTYASAIKRLGQLACPDGGWAWIDQYKEPSLWITENILTSMGRLKQLGYLPSDKSLNDMIANAVNYYDTQTAKAAKKSPDYTSPLFVLVRGFYPDIQMPVDIKNFVTRTVATESKQWKNRNVPQKAIDAIIFNKNGYPTIARQVIASLRDYAVTKSGQGMWWPSLDNMTVWSMGKISATSIVLDAFAQVTPASADVDLIRQWLILQKEAKDWGTSVSTSDAIASILLSGSKWTRPAQGAVVKVGKRTVVPGKVDEMLGYFRESISDLSPSGATLTVEKSSGTPSWGAVYAQYRNTMSEIKASACADLSIEKTLYKRVSAQDGIKWEAATDLNVGDVVQVNLTVVAGRDMDYVAIIDNHGACLEPTEQLPVPIYSEGVCFYRENRDSSTNIFVTHMPKGTYRLSYQMYVNNAGTFSAGIASIQSQYAPALSAHSSGSVITIGE